MQRKSSSKLKRVGEIIYAVNKESLTRRYNGTRIRVGRVKTYELRDEKMVPVIVEVGSRSEISFPVHNFYNTIEEAVTAFTPNKRKKKK